LGQWRNAAKGQFFFVLEPITDQVSNDKKKSKAVEASALVQ
jgi:hypothetical protein